MTIKLLKEKWHKYRISRGSGDGLSSCSCGVTGYMVREYCAKQNRTFTTPNDFFDCLNAMKKRKDWEKFISWLNHWRGTEGKEVIPVIDVDPESFADCCCVWLETQDK